MRYRYATSPDASSTKGRNRTLIYGFGDHRSTIELPTHISNASSLGLDTDGSIDWAVGSYSVVSTPILCRLRMMSVCLRMAQWFNHHAMLLLWLLCERLRCLFLLAICIPSLLLIPLCPVAFVFLAELVILVLRVVLIQALV